MAQSKSERAVRAVHPCAVAERHRPFGGEVFWLVRPYPRAYTHIGSGPTKAQAWNGAARTAEFQRVEGTV